MRSLKDVQEKMATLYEQVESGELELKPADSLANIAGKWLKAEQLALAREIFVDGKNKGSMGLLKGEQ